MPDTPYVPSNTVYTRLAEPLNLTVNKNPTSKWNLDFEGAPTESVFSLPEGAPFTAVGKAQRTDGDRPCFYMGPDDFGDADKTGVPAQNVGINTVDLSLPSMPTDTSLEDGEIIPVKVIPPNPFRWQNSYVAQLGTVNYVSNGSYAIKDLTGDKEDKYVNRGTILPIAGVFEKDGMKYLRTAKSVADGTWYGIPASLASRQSSMTEDELDDMFMDDDIDIKSIKKLSTRERLIKGGATVRGKLDKLLSLGKK